MSLNIQKFIRKPFPVEGVRVTKDNMQLVAEWCGGEIRQNAKGVKHVFIDVHRPMTERQTMAFVGDWVLFADRGYKIYTQNAFSRNFELVQAGTGSDHADFEPAPVDEEDTPLEIQVHGDSIQSYETKVKSAKQNGMKTFAQAAKEMSLAGDQLNEAAAKLRAHFKPEDGDPHRY